MNEPTQDLLARFAAGDRAACDTLIARYREPLRAFIRLRLDPAGELTVDDVLQQAHLRALQHLDRFVYRRELSFYFWLCAIARNELRMAGRARGRRPIHVTRARGAGTAASSVDILSALGASAPSPVDQALMRENLHLLAEALEAVPARRRHALILQYLEGHDGAAAAEKMGVSHGAFRVLVSRGLVELRAALAALLGEDAPA